MDADDIGRLFTRGDGSYLCARWGRPIVPVVFGVEDTTLGVIKGAVEAVVALAGHSLAETDTELGANLMLFFVRDWDELRRVPKLDQLITGLMPLLDRLEAAGANQYRAFRFDASGAIRACFVLVRMDAHLADLPAETLALSQAAQVMLTWGETAFAGGSPLGQVEGTAVLRPEVAAVIRAAYDPALPVAGRDASHALRLAARISV